MSLRRSALMALLGVVAFSAATSAAGAAAVKVELLDSSDGGKGMRIKTSPPSAPAGQIMFQVVNASKSKEHEMIVLKTDAASPAALPRQSYEDEIDLSGVQTLGKVEDLSPGASGNLTVNLAPGAYLLLCNEPGHAHQGMWARFRVTAR